MIHHTPQSRAACRRERAERIERIASGFAMAAAVAFVGAMMLAVFA